MLKLLISMFMSFLGMQLIIVLSLTALQHIEDHLVDRLFHVVLKLGGTYQLLNPYTVLETLVQLYRVNTPNQRSWN